MFGSSGGAGGRIVPGRPGSLGADGILELLLLLSVFVLVASSFIIGNG